MVQREGLIDKGLLCLVAGLLVYGLLMVASASMVISDKLFGHSFHYIIRQGIYLGLGVAVMAIAFQIPMAFWRKHSGYLIVLGFLLLALVLVPGIGRTVNGSRRWMHFGFITLQVSELVKFFMVLYFAKYCEHFREQLPKQASCLISPMVVLAIVVGLLLLEPDFGTAAVISVTVLLMLYLGGARLWPFVVLLVLVTLMMAGLAMLSPYRVARLTSFMNPWHSPFGSGYQLTQSLIAFGRGGVFGVGLGNSVQKLFYLPEAHTDFLFAVIGEELGLFGELLLLTLFVALVVRIFSIAKRAAQEDLYFSSMVAYGAGLWFGLQSLINLGVNVGLLPTKGITLPFISYGGSSMLVNCLVIGVLLRIAYEASSRRATSPPEFIMRSVL